MNLHLLNEYSSHNLGDAAIYATVAQLAAPLQACSAMDPERRRHAPALAGRRAAGAADAWLSVGGDIFNNGRPSLLTRRFIAQLGELAAAPPQRSFLFGQSVPGSCRGLAFALLARALRRLASVTVRDEASLRRLGEAGVDAELSWDLAFAYRTAAGARDAGRALMAAAGVEEARCVLISVREFDAMYPHDNHRFVADIAGLCAALRARGHQPALLLQSDAGGADSDRRVAARIVAELALRLGAAAPPLPVLDPFATAPGTDAVDTLCGLLAIARGAVAVRYHTAVLRLLGGGVPYSLHYAGKGLDLARRLALPGCSLSDFDPAAAVAGIEASFDGSHDPRPQQRHVEQAFRAGLVAALGAPLPHLAEVP